MQKRPETTPRQWSVCEDAFPTAVLSHRIAIDNTAAAPIKAEQKSDLAQFFSNSPDFEFARTNIEKYLRNNAEVAFVGVSDRDGLKRTLKGLQRLGKLTPHYDEIRQLWADGHQSAQSISRMGRTAFVRKYSDKLGGQTRAKTLYAKARRQSAMALTLFGKYAAIFYSTASTPQAPSSFLTGKVLNADPKAIEAVNEAIPNWMTLFGSPVLCDCEHCRSVYGPAAYLVDILEFLKNSGTAPTEFVARRPDIQHIELSCENTNTPLPYVDLVNEVLENAVSPLPLLFNIGQGFSNDLNNKIISPAFTQAFANNGLSLSSSAVIEVIEKGRWTVTDGGRKYSVKEKKSGDSEVSTVPQTRGTAEELNANPEYINQKAYDTLALQVYPFDLPLSLWVEEARTYLEHLGVRRHQLMEVFHKEETPSELTDINIAREYLGLTPEEAEIVIGVTAAGPASPTSDPGAWNFWGFSKENIDLIPDPADNSQTITGKWSDVLKRVDVFLHQSGLSYKELLELIGTEFINPDKELAIDSTDPDDEATCDLAKLTITSLTEDALGRIHRFIRLSRKLSWKLRDLDKTVTALNAPDLNDPFLVQLANIKRLSTELAKTPLNRLLSLWGSIDIASYDDGTKSLYDELFLNKAVMNPVDDAFYLDALATGNVKLSEHMSALLAAFGISEADLALLTKNEAAQAVLNLAGAEIQSDVLNLENLTHLLRLVSFAKALKLSVRDFLLVKVLTDINPFDSTKTEDTLTFVDKVQKIRTSRFTIPELNYLLRHHSVAPSGIAPTEESIAFVLDEIRSGLQKIAAENTFTPGAVDPGELTRKKLSTLPLIPADQIDPAIAIIDGTSTKTDADKEAFIETYFSTFLDPGDAEVQLVGVGALEGTEARFAYVLAPLMMYLRRTLSESFVKQKLAEALKLETASTELLLFKLNKSPSDPTKMTILLDQAFIESQGPLTEVGSGPQFHTLILLQKIASLVSGLKMRSEELGWIIEHGANLGFLDLNALPVTADTPTAPLFGAWDRLVDLFGLLERFPLLRNKLSSDEWSELAPTFGVADAALPSQRALLAAFGLAAQFNAAAGNAVNAEAALFQMLNKRTGWDFEEIKFLAGAQGFGFTFPDAYKDEQALLRLRNCFAALKRLGVTASKVLETNFEWTQPHVTFEVARNIKQAVKAKYDNAQWLTVAKPLRDILREKQRSALVSYLVAHPDSNKEQHWQDPNGLYEHFLIDVEMDPCMMTSRIKQAIGSVQLFIQRCLMNLEEGVSIPPAEAEQWKTWMKNYRVWEANRKVFLYPENWIEPELRDAKSPFFKSLENDLLQNEVNADTAENAFRNYLDRLDEVARLEIVGMYDQVEYPEGAVSQSGAVRGGAKPNFHILHVFGRTRGSAPIYYYRRRVNSTYWTAWEKVDVDIEGDHLIPVVWNRRLHIFWPVFREKTGVDLKKSWQPKIAWSEYKNKGWSAKKVSSDALESDDFPAEQAHLTFKAIGNLAIRCYVGKSADTVIAHDITDNSGKVIGQTVQKSPVPTGVLELIGEFAFAGCDGVVIPRVLKDENQPLLPVGTLSEYMMFVEDTSVIDIGLHTFWLRSSENDLVPVFNRTPTTFRLLPPHQDVQFNSQRPFFYQDDTRSFFVTPEDVTVYPHFFVQPDQIDLNVGDKVQDYYAVEQKIEPGPFTESFDPSIFELSLSAESFNIGVSTMGKAITTGKPMASMQEMNESQLLLMGGIPNLLNENLEAPTYTLLPTYQAEKHFQFETFYHPYVCELIKQLNRDGIDGLLQRSNQTELFEKTFFANDYEPDKVEHQAVVQPYPIDDVDFSYGGAYSLYNWELFFHAPLLIADRLSKNQRFEDAQKWFHYIFDPTDRSKYSVPQRFWKVRPFFENADVKKTIEDLLKLVNEGDEALVKEVEEWQHNPFKPHLVARLRIAAYQKTVVMKYIDNLIAGGDQLFRRDTIESINEATQLYVLAADILGERPQNIPPRVKAQVKTYKQLEPDLDAFKNAVVEGENLGPGPSEAPALPVDNPPPLPQFPTFYFCIPKNDKLLGYWDTVADRLFKIRNCMSIEGIARQLPLFEPPIDPAILVKAFAAGVDINSVLNDMSAGLPHYRFQVMAQKAIELCSDVKALGGALLSALEKRDAEELALLRSSHELNLLKAVTETKKAQIEEAKYTLEGLKKGRKVIEARQEFYRTIEFMNVYESAHIAALNKSNPLQLQVADNEHLAQFENMLPNISVPMGPPGIPSISFGGSNLGAAVHAFSENQAHQIANLNTESALNAAMGAHHRSWNEWKLQEELAARELKQVDQQIATAGIRVAIAERELMNHDLQVENAKEADEFMRSKFTNRELYDWMVSQISGVYFQSYQLAYDIAKRAERAYRFELGLTDSNFIQFGYWDSLKKGLLAGEKLHYDLKRMEMSYFDQNKREYEITKHISLLTIDPIALVKLKETGECFVDLSETLFDLDYPGQYMRRINSVSITIPCVTGPYTGVSCTLTLVKSSVRRSNTLLSGQYNRDLGNEDLRFADSVGAIQSIVTSSGQNDSGLFETDFHDERYLPFEGSGVISEWRIELSKDFRAFDYATISDVVFHLRYTAREGGGVLKQQAVIELQTVINEIALAENRAGLFRLISAKHEFPNDWHKFLHPKDTEDRQTLPITLAPERFPFQFKDKDIEINSMHLFLKCEEGFAYDDDQPLVFDLKKEGGTEHLAQQFNIAGSLIVDMPYVKAFENSNEALGRWFMEVKRTDIPQWLRQKTSDGTDEAVQINNQDHFRLNPGAIQDFVLVCQYSVM